MFFILRLPWLHWFWNQVQVFKAINAKTKLTVVWFTRFGYPILGCYDESFKNLGQIKTQSKNVHSSRKMLIMSRTWTRKKSDYSARRESNPWPPKHRGAEGRYSTHRAIGRLKVNRAIYYVRINTGFCILLRSAVSKGCSILKWRKIKLDGEMRKI